jgi:hypothetical protein
MKKAQWEVGKLEKFYNSHFKSKTKEKLKNMEQHIHQRKKGLTKSQIEEKMKSSVEELRFSRSTNTKMYKTIERYWVMKTIVA